MIRQARKVTEYDGGRGAAYLSADEYNRVVRVWLKGEKVPPIPKMSGGAWQEIMREARVEA